MSAAAAAPAPLLALCLSSLYTLFTAAISYPATSHHFPALPGTLHSTPLESITSHCHPCHRSYGFLFLGEQNRVFILSGIYYISIFLSFLYVRFIVAHCNASVGGVGAVFCVLVFCISCNTPQLYYDTRQSIKYTVRNSVQTNKIQTKFISYLTWPTTLHHYFFTFSLLILLPLGTLISNLFGTIVINGIEFIVTKHRLKKFSTVSPITFVLKI